MPPRKVDKTPVNPGEPKVLRSRTKRKVVEKDTSGIKITIPVQNVRNNIANLPEDEIPMPGKNDFKIMLANEVVRRQFPNKKTLIEEPNELTNNVRNNKFVKKTILPGKRKDKNSETPQRKRRRTINKKNLTVFNNEQCEEQLEITKETMLDVKKKETKKPVRLKRNTVRNSISDDKQNEVKVQKTTPNAVTKRNVVTNRKTGPRPGPKTRKKAMAEENEIKNKDIENNETKSDNIEIKDSLTPRRTSIAGSELSWTKDISSSSTSTCLTVSTNDFFRIDNKLPVIKLTNVDRQLRSGDIANTNNESVEEKMEVVENGVNTTDMHLSSSSSSSSSSDEESCQNVQNTQDLSTLDKLASKLKNFDLEIMNWIGYSEKSSNNEVTKIQDKLFSENFLHEERDVILHCQSINRILSENDLTDENEKEICDNHNEVNVETNNNNVSDNTIEAVTEISEQNISNIETKPCQFIQPEDKLAHNSTCNDEDDALSLYAESITDFESPRNWNHRSRENIEEYVPLPANCVFKKPEKVIYKPTKIKKTVPKEPENAVEVVVCEKSNADSTSMYKENNESASDENTVFYEDRVGEIEKEPPKIVKNQSIGNLMAAYQKPKHSIHGQIFRNVCVFNLTTGCKNKMCKFYHTFFDKDQVVLKLRKLNDQLFQEEYVFVRNWSSLRRLYGLCFVEDCIRRKLTRVLVELTLDLVNKSSNMKEDTVLVVEAIEAALVYLNDINMEAYCDLLKHKIKGNRLLCDAYMDTIVKSQNFSRFKTIFINLTNFMCELGSAFNSDMVSQVLERVCILPYDFNLAHALIKVIKNTDINIFCNPMMKNFENQLLLSSAELYEEFRNIKEKSPQNVRTNCYNSSLDSDTERVNSQGYSESNIRYSPDTTNLDNFNKTQIEPQFKRTVDLKKLSFFNDLPQPHSSSSESEDKYTYRRYNAWKNKRQNNNRHLSNSNIVHSRSPAMRPPLRPAFKRRSDKAFGSSPCKFPRRSGPSYY